MRNLLCDLNLNVLDIFRGPKVGAVSATLEHFTSSDRGDYLRFFDPITKCLSLSIFDFSNITCTNFGGNSQKPYW